MHAKIDRLERKKPRDAEKELKLLLKAEQYINKELMLHSQAMYAAATAESTMLKCQMKVKDLHIRRLVRRLKNGRTRADHHVRHPSSPLSQRLTGRRRAQSDPTTNTSTRPGDHVRVNHAHPRCGIDQWSV